MIYSRIADSFLERQVHFLVDAFSPEFLRLKDHVFVHHLAADTEQPQRLRLIIVSELINGHGIAAICNINCPGRIKRRKRANVLGTVNVIFRAN